MVVQMQMFVQVETLKELSNIFTLYKNRVYNPVFFAINFIFQMFVYDLSLQDI